MRPAKCPEGWCIRQLLTSVVSTQRRSITVRAARAAARAQAQRETEAQQRASRRDPYRPVAARPLGPVPMDVQRAYGVFRRGLIEGNLEVVLPNYRIVAARKYLHAISLEEFCLVLRALAEPLNDRRYVPGKEEVDQWKSVFNDLIANCFNHERGHVPEDIYAIFIDAYSRRGDIESLSKIWDHMHRDGVQPSLNSYNLILKCCAKEGLYEKAEEVYHSLLLRPDIEPDATTYSALINVRASVSDIPGAHGILEKLLETGGKPPIKVLNALLTAHKKQGDLEGTEELFALIKKNGLVPNIATYNTMLDAYSKANALEKAVAIVNEMQSVADSSSRPYCAPDFITYNILINMFGKADKPEDALKLFHDMLERGIPPDVVTFTSIMDAYGRQGDLESTRTYFNMMHQYGLIPSAASYAVLINAMGYQGDLKAAETVYTEMVQRGISPTRPVYRSLVRVHEIANDPQGAARWYMEMTDKHISPDVTTLISIMRVHVRNAQSGQNLLDVIRTYYKDAERFGRLKVGICNELLRAHLKCGVSVAEAVSTVYETEFRMRRIPPNSFTLEILVQHGASAREDGGSGTESDFPEAAEMEQKWRNMVENHPHTSTGSSTNQSKLSSKSITSADRDAEQQARTDQPTPSQPATREHIIQAFVRMADRARRGDSITQQERITITYEQLMEARALLEVFGDLLKAGTVPGEFALNTMAKRVEQLLGKMNWVEESGALMTAASNTRIPAPTDGTSLLDTPPIKY
ncbi:pentatricopeptide repeat domain-containing protein [Spizellomyces punctatus DAOM BR117]|uniref:Pentatricopeptide repeat domain-containing protein n=1 Tax=Spizellomyces punctatus (strain DAOM BR117) TaxID=645134 RepID=A0A0L0HPH7_SPIPD|nr:pentatricopeptide repeat domain-containing protein [Spizellomyces punctatus DAOM BR117]KND03306.1 pentatricopeptide repeat domain-containing protein [Spizellomyces punctatus DAOM BR117]|eukprot:XP_016611345.1 pentatricopeptide repeat domain-containing protein [Spizellomyces punctatus DAOM BR117]